jgi:hypothetical protein
MIQGSLLVAQYEKQGYLIDESNGQPFWSILTIDLQLAVL